VVDYLGKVPQCRTPTSLAAEATRAIEGTRPPAATAHSAGMGAEALLMPRSAPEVESGGVGVSIGDWDSVVIGWGARAVCVGGAGQGEDLEGVDDGGVPIVDLFNVEDDEGSKGRREGQEGDSKEAVISGRVPACTPAHIRSTLCCILTR